MATEEDWQEQDSADFLAYGDVFVPEREAQLEVVASVIPSPEPDAEVLDLCCGEGRLSGALLAAFPGVRVVGLDISPTMRRAASQGLAGYGDRFRAEHFDLDDAAWRRRSPRPAAVVSSLALHHLDAAHKRALFGDLRALLRPGGSLVIADLVQPVGDRGLELARRGWDEAVRERSLAATGGLAAYEKFHALEWSCYEHPNELDRPSPLLDQLDWLREAGFEQVDVYWMRAGHAIFGGVTPAAPGA